MNNIGNLPAHFFMASLSAMAGGQESSLIAGGGHLASSSLFKGDQFVFPLSLPEGIGSRVVLPPLFRPREDRHRTVPLELLGAYKADTFQEGARVYLELSFPPYGEGLGWEKSVAGEMRLATGERVGSGDSKGKFIQEVDRNIQDKNYNYFNGVEFREQIEQLTDPQRLDLALAVEKHLGDENRAVREATIEALKVIIPPLEAKDRLDLALAVENRLGDEGWGVRYAAIEALKVIIPHLEAKDRLGRALAIEKRLVNKWDRKSDIQPLVVIIQHLEVKDRLNLALAVEKHLGDENPDVRQAAIVALKAIIPHLEVKDRLDLALAVEKHLGDKNRAVRRAAFQVLAAITPHLEVKDRLNLALAVEKQLMAWSGYAHSPPVQALEVITPHLEPKDRLDLALAVKNLLGEGRGYVHQPPVQALDVITPHLEAKDRLDLALAVKNLLGDENPHVRLEAFEAMEAIIPHLGPKGRLDLALALEKLLGDKDWKSFDGAVEILKAIIPHLEAKDRLDRALAIENQLGDENGGVRQAAIEVLKVIIPHLEPKDRQELKSLGKGRGASVGAISRIFTQLTDYNREQVMTLLIKAIRDIGFKGQELPATLHFWADVFERWPRLGYPVLEGLVEGVEKRMLSKDPGVEEKEKILRFVEMTHGFVPAVYAAYKREGTKILEEIQGYGNKILSEEMGLEELKEIAGKHEADGGMEFVLAVIQAVSPTSGASFVERSQQVGLLKKMMEAGDQRKDIPKSWRGVVKSFEMEQGSWRLKEGERADPEGKILALLKQFRGGEEKQVDEAKALEGLKTFLQSERLEEDLKSVRAILFVFAGSRDALREKIDRIQDNDYATLELLDQLFRDKDNLTVLIRDLLGKIPAELLVDRIREGKKQSLLGNADKLVKELRKQLSNPKIEEAKRIRAVANMLGKYTPESLEAQLLKREGVNGTELERVIRTALEEAPGLGKGKIIEAILSEPLKRIEAEKQKFIYEVGEPARIGLRAVKGPAFGMFGLSAGVCTATDIELWKKPDFKLLAIADEANRKVVGYIHAFESENEKGERILTLPGINPSSEFMATVEAEKLYSGLVGQVIEFAKLEGYAAVYIPTGPNIQSNRSGIQKAIQKSGYEVIQIPEVNWNTLPEPYPFSEVYVVWRKD